MRIVHLSKSDVMGGAARAAYRLHKGLQRVGHDSMMWVASRTCDDPTVLSIERPEDLGSRVRRGLRQHWAEREFKSYRDSRPAGYELFSDDRGEFSGTLMRQLPDCDVINLHWVPGLLDYRTFFGGGLGGKPVVWTFHDMNAFTGGCHYGLGCEAYLNRCGKCPQLGSGSELDLAYQIWRRKQKVFASMDRSQLRIVAPSRWLAGEAQRSGLLANFDVSVIPYGLCLEDFAPRDRNLVRDLLGIPRGARVVLFVAEQVNNRRKGFPLLVDALKQCNGRVPDLWLLSVGLGKPHVGGNIPSLHLGALSNDKFLSMVYSAADVFVICSLQDNLPNTVLESLACGTPVVGVAVGGIPDMIRHGVNGLTVDSTDAGALAAAIEEVLNSADGARGMSEMCRRIASEEYSLELQAERYLDVYSSMVGGGSGSRGAVDGRAGETQP